LKARRKLVIIGNRLQVANELNGEESIAYSTATALPYERAYPEVAYLRGLAYLRWKKGAEAAAEFKKILDHKGTSWGSTWRDPNWGLHYSISYLGLARALALAGDAVPARRAYEDLFVAWKDADTDIPILQQARAEYAKLR